MIMETDFSMVTRISQLKHVFYRHPVYLETHLALVVALFNLLLALNRLLEPEAAFGDRRLHPAQYSF
jgi:hypothetical protein